MESTINHFNSLNRDLLHEIMLRLDACTLAATASTSTYLHDAAGDEGLWQKLCHVTWPSTFTRREFPFQKTKGGFRGLYSDAFPLILYEVKPQLPTKFPTGPSSDHTPSSPRDFISFVDIYYKGHCIFSKTNDGVIEGLYRTCRDSLDIFSCYPFKLDLLDVSENYQDLGSSDSFSNISSIAFVLDDEREDQCNAIVQGLRLSWILFDKRQGKAANISSWRPRSIQRSNLSRNAYIIHFGCVIPMEDIATANTLAECVITVNCKLMVKQQYIIWRDITLVIKDVNGFHLNGEQSMMAMKQTLICSRSMNHDMVELGYQQFRKQKLELKLRREQEESLANILCATVAIAALVGICYACATLFSTLDSSA